MLPFVALAMLVLSEGMVHDLKIERDERSLYRIESFCFTKGGQVDLSISDFRVHGAGSKGAFRCGFVMRKAASESAAQQELEESLEQQACLLDYEDDSKTIFQIDLTSPSRKLKREIKHGEEGLYSLIFARCAPDEAVTSYRLKASFANPGPRFLSACDAALPALFAAFFLAYLVLTVFWCVYLLCAAGESIPLSLCITSSPLVCLWRLPCSLVTISVRTEDDDTHNDSTKTKTMMRVHYIHWVMAILLVFKSFAMLSQAMRYHYVDVMGTGEGWQFVYYVFASLKGVTLFVVILLIGTGWSLVKPYLSNREKRVVLVVLCLQVVDNVALVFFEETAPGSQRWLTWRDVLHLVDIVCCCAILFPIVWSIRHLRQAASADGKTADTIHKLTLFRQFYVMVVTYIYFTRIVVFLLAATLPFDLLWLRYVFSEAATIAFYAVTGIKFRPRVDNPYLPLKRDGDDDDNDDDCENSGNASLNLDAEFGTVLDANNLLLGNDQKSRGSFA